MDDVSKKVGTLIHPPGELDFVDKLLQPEARSRVEELVKKGRTRGPFIVEFDPTTVCNFACPECISIGLLNKGQINPNRVIELINEFSIAGVRGIIFIGGGEPLAHSSMPQPIIHAHKLGMSVGLTTNGSLVDRYIDTIAECIKWTRFSVDAATEPTFNTFRPSHIKNAFSKVISNIERLAKVKKGKIGYSFLLLERSDHDKVLTNCHELLEAAKLAKNIGCDYFEFKPSVDAHHHLIPLSQPMKAMLAQQMKLLGNLETANFRIIYPKSIEHLFTSKSPDQPKSYTSCPTIELRTVVTSKGIYPCPYKRGSEHNLMGSPDIKFDEYWVSTERIAKAREVNPKVDCTFFCIRHEMNDFLNNLSSAYIEGIDLLKDLMEIQVEDDIFI